MGKWALAEEADAGVPLLRVYGTLMPTVGMVSGAVESFSQPNATAPIAAGNPVLASGPQNAHLTFQVGQSRFGVMLGEGTAFRGQVEVDFVDFTKASPTVASAPRLRLMRVAWLPSESFQLQLGQDWDLVQPVNPHGVNMVGAMFEAGNSGFMRQQVKALGVLGPIELGAAIGLQNNNNTAKDGVIELGLVPTFAGRVQWNVAGVGKVGLSGLATSVTYKLGTADEAHTFAGEVGAYADLTFSGVNVRAEGYLAKNGANLYLLGLSQGRAGAGNSVVDLRDTGGFVSVKVPVGPVNVYGQLGGAMVLNPEQVVASYTYGTVDPTAPLPAFSTATLAGTGPGILWNVLARVGVEVKLMKGLNAVVEGFWLRTKHRLLALDEDRVGTVAQAFGGEVALVYGF